MRLSFVFIGMIVRKETDEMNGNHALVRQSHAEVFHRLDDVSFHRSVVFRGRGAAEILVEQSFFQRRHNDDRGRQRPRVFLQPSRREDPLRGPIVGLNPGRVVVIIVVIVGLLLKADVVEFARGAFGGREGVPSRYRGEAGFSGEEVGWRPMPRMVVLVGVVVVTIVVVVVVVVVGGIVFHNVACQGMSGGFQGRHGGGVLVVVFVVVVISVVVERLGRSAPSLPPSGRHLGPESRERRRLSNGRRNRRRRRRHRRTGMAVVVARKLARRGRRAHTARGIRRFVVEAAVGMAGGVVGGRSASQRREELVERRILLFVVVVVWMGMARPASTRTAGAAVATDVQIGVVFVHWSIVAVAGEEISLRGRHGGIHHEDYGAEVQRDAAGRGDVAGAGAVAGDSGAAADG
mmetsp:Transcript_25949/g.53661  ORF Transcript_25949/g.53661 Transcript_25949/m.53661 type:complete len:405 (-) Transcript_25949:52-1266(-)